MMPVSARTSSQSRPSQFPPTTPRVIQISTIPESDSHSFIVFALTADGEIFSNAWDLTTNPQGWEGWLQLPPLPPANPLPGDR
jgi:hypothetical protein